jgi:cell division protein FtsI (penicillin-binding protein 3)
MNKIFKRASFLYWFVVLVAIAVISQIVYLQYIAPEKMDYREISFRTEEIEAQRGSILSTDGRLLATSIPYYQIRMDCVFPSDTTINNNLSVLSDSLSKFFGDKSASEYKKDILKARNAGNRYKSLGNRLVDHSELLRIKKFPLFRLKGNKGGLVIEQKNIRTYPYGTLARRTIGYINSEGVSVGIEGRYDFALKGVNGRQTVQKLLGGEWMPVDIDNTILPEDGNDVRTTIDANLQEVAEQALKEQLSINDVFEGATAIVMEVKTGAIRAIANQRRKKDGTFDEIYNYAIGDATEPGSTFKLASLVVFLEDNKVNLNTMVDAGNGSWKYSVKTYTDVTAGGYGNVTVQQAFEHSSNVAFAKLAVQHYANDEKSFVDRIHSMKLMEHFNLDVSGEGRATIFTPEEKQYWSKLALPSMAIGYGVKVTPLHTLTFYNAIANDGKMMKPYFIESFERGGKIVKQFEPQELSGSICSKKTVKEVQKALRGVVENGTAKAFNDYRYKISGKTGTARIVMGKSGYEDENGFKRHQASFAGYFPSDNPRYSVIVVFYTNKTKENFYGAGWAAPVFKKIADRVYESTPDWNHPLDGRGKTTFSKPKILRGDNEMTAKIFTKLKMGDIPLYDTLVKQKNDSTLIISDSLTYETIPNVLNMGLRDAMHILENSGYKVKFSGRGRIVEQIPAPGLTTSNTNTITLKLSDNYEK